jgi:hypothetical protein
MGSFFFLFGIALGIVAGIWKAAVFCLSWNWFVPEFWPVMPRLELGQAWVLMAIVALLVAQDHKSNKEEDFTEAMIRAIVAEAGRCVGWALYLTAMWIAWHFIMAGRI